MNKNFKFFKLNIVAIATISVLTALQVNAVIPPFDPDGNPNTIVNVDFKPGNAGVGPLDPDLPGEPEPGGPDGGNLAFNYAEPISFGEQDIAAGKMVYESVTKRPYIQVTDLRGTFKGWTVQAQLSKFKNEDDFTLKDAALTLKNVSLNTTTQGINPPRPESEVILFADGNTKRNIVTAEYGEGMGTWLVRWYTNPAADTNSSVTLEVLGGTAKEGANIATITWYLLDVPTIMD